MESYAGPFFPERAFPARYWPGAGVQAAGTRIFSVASEDRCWVVAAEDREWEVGIR